MVIQTNGLVMKRQSLADRPLYFLKNVQTMLHKQSIENVLKKNLRKDITSDFFKTTFKDFKQLPKNGKVTDTFNIPSFPTYNTEEKFANSLVEVLEDSYQTTTNLKEIDIVEPINLPKNLPVNCPLRGLFASPSTITRIPDNIFHLENLTTLTLSSIASDLPDIPDNFEFQRTTYDFELIFDSVRSSNFQPFLNKILKNAKRFTLIINFENMENVPIEDCSAVKELSFMECNTINFSNFKYLYKGSGDRSYSQGTLFSMTQCQNILFPDVMVVDRSISLSFIFNDCGITGLHPTLLTLSPYSRIFLQNNGNISLSTYENLMALNDNNGGDYPEVGISLPSRLRGQIDRQPLNFEDTITFLFKEEENKKTVMEGLELITDHRFQRWILKLGEFIQNNCKILVDLIPDILVMLEEMLHNSEYFEVALEIMEDATSTCGDRVILSVLYLSVQYKMYTIKYDVDSIDLIFETVIRGPYIMSILEEVAREKVKTLRFFDEIEVYLAYPIMLRERFKIPIATKGMLFYTISAVSESDIKYATKRVKTMLTNKDNIASFLFTQSVWTKMLFHLYPDEPIEEEVYFDLTKQLMDEHTLSIEY
jgi:hypothetical protein